MKGDRVLIWGAGKIGRGFLAELFFKEDYRIAFIDQSKPLVETLNKNGSYHVILARKKNDVEEVNINQFKAFTTDQKSLIQDEINRSGIIAISVFPKDYETVTDQLRELLIKRRSLLGETPINILLCTNLVHAGPIFQKHLIQGLTEEMNGYFERNIGVVETLVIRICPDPVNETLKNDPLAVLTNGYPELPVDRNSFKGEIPSLDFLRLVKDMRAEEIRKIYTYNMFHAVLSYLGHMRGYKYLVECLTDTEIQKIALGALNEVSAALQKEYSFSPQEMDIWISDVIDQTNNSVVNDTVVRSAADPLRKLQMNDRLVGPALLCIKNGIKPDHLCTAIGAAFCYQTDEDGASKKLQETVSKIGVKAAIMQVCDLTAEKDDLIDGITSQYLHTLLKYFGDEIAENASKLAFNYEKSYHGCGQCVLAALLESTNLFNEEVFRSATGLCGGVGQITGSTCSAFLAGCMIISLIFPRRYKYFASDRESKYKSFELIQKFHKRFLNEYGSTTCQEIHQDKYGRTFDLTKKPEAESFELAGAHGDHGCTEVVANSSRWTIELLADDFQNYLEKVSTK